MPRSRKSQRAKRKAVLAMALPMKRPDGIVDLTPHIASMNIVMEGKYLELGKGYLVTNKHYLVRNKH